MIASTQSDIVLLDRGAVGIGHRLRQSGRSPNAVAEQNTTGVALRAIETDSAGDEIATEIAVPGTGTHLSRPDRRLQFVFNLTHLHLKT
jgi:hypothetical protein